MREFLQDDLPDLKKDYIDTGKIRFIFREFPHKDAALAAFMLARCAPKEKYFPLVDMFFAPAGSGRRSRSTGLYKIAQLAGFTQESFDACLKNETVAKGIMAVRNKAEGFGVIGIPTFFINGEVEGETTIEEFRRRLIRFSLEERPGLGLEAI